METIYALSSGRPPAAIAVVRISGPSAFMAVEALTGDLPPPRHASLRTLRDEEGGTLDHALVLTFPGPRTATAENLAELHLHGGRAVVDAVLAYLSRMKNFRTALPGEFTRRALLNGRVDLAQAQGLADLLEAETDTARRAALAATEGAVGRQLGEWSRTMSEITAMVEAAIDYEEEGDVGGETFEAALRLARELRMDMRSALSRPSVERLRDGPIIVLAGPPNAGKSSLFNALLMREAAIVTPIAGTTRDVLEAQVVRHGSAYRLVDTAGLRHTTDDPIEAMGIERAQSIMDAADIILWLGRPEDAPERALLIQARADETPSPRRDEAIATSVRSPDTIEALWQTIEDKCRVATTPDMAFFHEETRHVLLTATGIVEGMDALADDPLIVAEEVRRAHGLLAGLMGTNATESMLDALFSRFCVGK